MISAPLTVTSLHRPTCAKGTTIDVGLGGAACRLDTPLRLGEAVQVVLTLDIPRVVNAEVAWITWAEGSEVRLGLRFSRDDAEELSGILDALGVLGSDVGT